MWEDAGMNWTTERPGASGYYYWWREPGGQEPRIVEVNIKRRTVSSLSTDEASTLDEMDGEWYGPLLLPR